MLLAGDIGGTKTVLALFDPEVGARVPHAETTFESDDYASLGAVVADYLAQNPCRLTGAAFGVAGPVVDGRARTTNLPWEIDAAQLASELDVPFVRLLNDLEAFATAVPVLGPGDLAVLNAGDPEPRAPIAVIAPGTGLGEAYLTWDGDSYRAYPSEGGHAGFGPENDEEVALLAFMRRRFPRVSFERVCSGRAIPDLYAFQRENSGLSEEEWLREAIAAAEDPTPVISEAALAGRSPLAEATMRLFVGILGSEAGNLALKLGALGGVYLGGGIPPRILPLLRRPEFLDAFRRKGRFATLLNDVPVYVILNPRMGLCGVAMAGLRQSEP